MGSSSTQYTEELAVLVYVGGASDGSAKIEMLHGGCLPMKMQMSSSSRNKASCSLLGIQLARSFQIREGRSPTYTTETTRQLLFLVRQNPVFLLKQNSRSAGQHVLLSSGCFVVFK